MLQASPGGSRLFDRSRFPTPEGAAIRQGSWVLHLGHSLTYSTDDCRLNSSSHSFSSRSPNGIELILSVTVYMPLSNLKQSAAQAGASLTAQPVGPNSETPIKSLEGDGDRSYTSKRAAAQASEQQNSGGKRGGGPLRSSSTLNLAEVKRRPLSRSQKNALRGSVACHSSRVIVTPQKLIQKQGEKKEYT